MIQHRTRIHVLQRPFLIIIALLLIGIVATPNKSSAQSDTIRLVDHLGASVTAVFADGDTAYIGQGTRFVVLDVSDSDNPVVIGESDPLGEGDPFGWLIVDIDVVGNRAYVTAHAHGLIILDISNKSNPVVIGNYDVDSISTRAVHVVGNIAYVANSSGGLLIVDVSDPYQPTLIGSYTFDQFGDAVDIQVVGNTVYMAVRNIGLMIFDVTNPAYPSLLGSYTGTFSAEGVHVVSNIAYIADQSKGLVVVDVSNSSYPAELGSYKVPGIAYDVQVIGDTAYVSDLDGNLSLLSLYRSDGRYYPWLIGAYSNDGSLRRLYVSDDKAYIADEENGFLIVDVSTTSSPALLGSHISFRTIWDLDVSGNTAFIAGNQGGLVMVDTTDPADLTLLDRNATKGSASVAQVVGNTVYTVGSEGLVITDVGDRRNPVVLSTLNIVQNNNPISSLQVVNNMAYIVNGIADDEHNLLIVDVSNRYSPVWIASYNMDTYSDSVDVVGDVAYITHREGLLVLDVSNPYAPTVLSTYWINDNYSTNTDVADNVAYILNGTEGLTMLDVSNPSSPVWLGSYDPFPIDFVHGEIQVIDNIAYIVNALDGLLIVDVSDPSNAKLLTSYDTGGYEAHVDVVGNLVYVGAEESGLYVLEYVPYNEPDVTSGSRILAAALEARRLIEHLGGVLDSSSEGQSIDCDKFNTFYDAIGRLPSYGDVDPIYQDEHFTYRSAISTAEVTNVSIAELCEDGGTRTASSLNYGIARKGINDALDDLIRMVESLDDVVSPDDKVIFPLNADLNHALFLPMTTRIR